MKNVRGAGRKPKLTKQEIVCLRKRRADGEKVSDLALEYGISRQAMSKYLNPVDNYEIKLQFGDDKEIYAEIYVDKKQESLRIINYAKELSKLPFGWKQSPSWDDLLALLEKEYLGKNRTEKDIDEPFIFLEEKKNEISFSDASSRSNLKIIGDEDIRFKFSKKDLLIARTDTDGYQMKAISSDRKWFVKSQAVISGVALDDWAVEIIATDLCNQLEIPCVQQFECAFLLGSKEYKGVYSRNFELDGYTFISFESLLERIHTSSKSEEFVRMNAIEKLEWCASMLSQIGNLDYKNTHKYMLDLCLIDILVGNIDRHTRNFGLFYNHLTGRYEIPLIFDNGMGLFENDYYRDQYSSYDEAMNNVYVSPYGEDPFDMFDMISEKYDLKILYKSLGNISYQNILENKFVNLYQKKMLEKIGELYGRS